MKKEKYQPSNGTEGMWFTSKFCERCQHEKFMHTNNHKDKMCDIFTKTMNNDVTDDDYPEEWTYDKDNKPTCTKFKFWNWGVDPENLNEPPEEEIFNPNQIKLEL